MTPEPRPAPHPLRLSAATRRIISLLAIPLFIFACWITEVSMLAGSLRLMANPEPAGFALYTVTACILTGMIVPVLWIRNTFITGAVNMFQIGFRQPRRAVSALCVSGPVVAGILLIANPFGTDRLALAGAFILLVPTAAASVMVCWALVGTHVQAFFRDGGVLISISTGVFVTSILSAAAACALDPPLPGNGPLFWPVCSGIVTALFFFAVRDVYATTIVAAGCGVLASPGMFDPARLHVLPLWIYLFPVIAVAALIGIHLFLFRNFRTIVIPEKKVP